MPTLEERVAVLESESRNQKEATKDQENRLRVVEELGGVVVALKDTVEKQGINMDKQTENMDKLASAINTIQQEKAKTDGIINLIKGIKPKDIIFVLLSLILLGSAIAGTKVNTDTINQIKDITNQLAVEEVITDGNSGEVANNQ